MSNVRIVLNKQGVKELLNSPEIQGFLMEKGQQVAAAADGLKQTPSAQFHAVAVKTPGRGIVRVSAANRQGVRDNLENNTLIKAKDSV